jgi:hypothetical protein
MPNLRFVDTEHELRRLLSRGLHVASTPKVGPGLDRGDVEMFWKRVTEMAKIFTGPG